MDEAKKRCHSSRLQYKPPNLACLGLGRPTRSSSTVQYCIRLQPPGVGRGQQAEEADEGSAEGHSTVR